MIAPETHVVVIPSKSGVISMIILIYQLVEVHVQLLKLQ
jgi:hypothetical protein